jgi:hypothetical protein
MREFEDAVQDLQTALRALERLFRATTPEGEALALVHRRIAAAVHECGGRIEAMLFEADDLDTTARLARFERLLSEMTRERKLALVARLEGLLGEGQRD